MKKILFFAFAALLLVSCKKEDTIRKNLYSHGGIWDVSKVEETTKNTPGTTVENVIVNAGFVVFNEDGTGQQVLYTDSTIVQSKNFRYYGEKDKMTVVMQDNMGKVYSLDWAKNRIVLTWKDKGQYYDPNISDTVHFEYTVKTTCNKRK